MSRVTEVLGVVFDRTIARLESVYKQNLLFALGRHALPGSYCERLDFLRLHRVSDYHKVGCTTFVYDLLMERIGCRQLR